MNLSSIRSTAWSVVETYRVANPTVIRQVFKSRPPGYGALPCAYVGDVRTSLNHDTGLRMWTAEVDVVLIDSVTDNEESMARLDTAAMAVVDLFSDQPHAFGGNTVGEPRGVSQTTDDVNGVAYEARVVTVGRILFTEGR